MVEGCSSPRATHRRRVCRLVCRHWHTSVAVYLGIGMRKVDLKALDRAYSEAFPDSTPLNVNKKKRREKDYRKNKTRDRMILRF